MMDHLVHGNQKYWDLLDEMGSPYKYCEIYFLLGLEFLSPMLLAFALSLLVASDPGCHTNYTGLSGNLEQ